MPEGITSANEKARLLLDGLNLFNARANRIEYFYASQLRGEAGPAIEKPVHGLVWSPELGAASAVVQVMFTESARP